MGFRPFVYRLAVKHGLMGEVDNRTNGVSVIVRGDIKSIDRFSSDILENAPPSSHIKSISVIPRIVGEYDDFRISDSKLIDNQITEVSPDMAVCPDCLADMASDPERLGYPLINCTNCGPRFTIIEGLPYDRPKTTMKTFEMCDKCRSDYNNILDRRFHAQPVACNSCGPEYIYSDPEKSISGTDLILKEISLRLTAGNSVAVKGTGGYHLMCDALNDAAVTELRIRKRRDAKPFAVMFRHITEVRKFCFVDETEEKELISWRRPVVILRERIPLAGSVSNGLRTIGAMLPYMPFHYLLFGYLKSPAVVLTSGNLSDEPVVADDDTALRELMPVTGSVVSYNRAISNRADDSVTRIINNNRSIIRRSRGFVPAPVDTDYYIEGIMAAGGEQKNSFCIGKNRQAVMSQHIGDLSNPAAREFYRESIRRFSDLFMFEPEYLACDLHPDYYSSVYASLLGRELNIPLVKIQHHHAHIVSCMAEHGIDGKVIGVSLDGTGYGTDGNIWGGEFMLADTTGFSRFTHFDYVPLPGGDQAVNQPWRMAFSYLSHCLGDTFDFESLPVFKAAGRQNLYLLQNMISKNINSPLTSSAGRLFDAVSALLGLCTKSSFESEAPMRLESAIDCSTDLYYPFSLGETVVFDDTFRSVISDMQKSGIPLISAKFHNTIARVILGVAEKIREESGVNDVMLSGGVFQNKYLLEKSIGILTLNRFRVFTNHIVPSNDGGISLGQLIIASKHFGLCA